MNTLERTTLSEIQQPVPMEVVKKCTQAQTSA